MSEYVKFWLAKELVPLSFVAFLALMFGVLFAAIYVHDLAMRLLRKWRNTRGW